MPNHIEDANLRSSRFVDPMSRYIESEPIYYVIGQRKILTFKTYKKNISNIPTANDMYMVISPGHEYRPDLVSQKMYGRPHFWWKIMEANDIKDIMDFRAGRNIRLPGNVY